MDMYQMVIALIMASDTVYLAIYTSLESTYIPLNSKIATVNLKMFYLWDRSMQSNSS